jgi:hypothetical protein
VCVPCGWGGMKGWRLGVCGLWVRWLVDGCKQTQLSMCVCMHGKEESGEKGKHTHMCVCMYVDMDTTMNERPRLIS